MKRSIVIDKMNHFGRKGIPFLFAIDFEQEKPFVYALDDMPSSIHYRIGSMTNSPFILEQENDIGFDAQPLPLSEYKVAFGQVKEEIDKGNSYLLNLCFPTRLDTSTTLEEFYNNRNAPFQLYVKNQFVVFSPESFVTITDNQISTFPMKGTIDADIPDAYNRLISDQKEMAEHATIVDLMRNDLSRVAQNVVVEKYRFAETLKTSNKNLIQTSSKISGTLRAKFTSSLGSLLFELLPAGSISGAPKTKTVEIIKRVESVKRGFYTGVFGIFDGKQLSSAVMIRFIEKTKDGLVYKSGCGITAQSDPKLEYQELIDKVYVPAT